MQHMYSKGALLCGAIATALSVPVTVLAHPHPQAKEKVHRITHKLAHKPPVKRATIAVTYTGEASKKASISNSGFWLNGVGIDGAATFRRGLGLAANFSIVHAHDSTASTSIGKTTIVFGPRFTKDIKWTRNPSTQSTGNSGGRGKWLRKDDWFKKMPPSQIFAEALFGIAHGSDGAYPEGSIIATSANSGAFQLGVGIDVALRKHLGARLFELDYIRTGLPNGFNNNQNDLRLSFGISYTWNSATPDAGAASSSPTAAVADADAELPGLMPIPSITIFPVQAAATNSTGNTASTTAASSSSGRAPVAKPTQ